MAENQSGRKKGGARGSPLGKKNPPTEFLVKNVTIVFETDLILEAVKILVNLSHVLMQIPSNKPA
jgi:hypothetical protein